MVPIDLGSLYEALRTYDPLATRQAVGRIASELDNLAPEQVHDLVEALSSLFYIDLGDKPEYVSVVEDTVATIAAIGEPAIPKLMELMCESDIKANLMFARTLGRIGPPAYGPLKDLFYRAQIPWHRVLALFALAKMHEAALMEILPDVVNSLDDSDRELRDTAIRTLGKIIDTFQPGQLPKDLVSHAFERLLLRLNDPSPVMRAKAARTIGKIAKKRYLDDEQKSSAIEALQSFLNDRNGGPDPSYLVRREAEEALAHFKLYG